MIRWKVEMDRERVADENASMIEVSGAENMLRVRRNFINITNDESRLYYTRNAPEHPRGNVLSIFTVSLN